MPGPPVVPLVRTVALLSSKRLPSVLPSGQLVRRLIFLKSTSKGPARFLQTA
jgi:hypothetical protein